MTQKITLAFRDPSVEREYDRFAAAGAVGTHRIVWCSLLVGNGFVAVADLTAAGTPANLATINAVRFGVMVPLVVGTAALGWAPFETFARWRTVVTAVGCAAVSWGQVLQGGLMPDPTAFRFLDSAMSAPIAILGLCSICATRAVTALVAVGPAVLALCIVGAVRWQQIAIGPFAFWASMALIAGIVIAWRIEQTQREAFLATRRSEALLRNVLPEVVAERLKNDASRIADHFDEVTVLFGDIVGFTPMSARMAPAELVAILDEVFSAFDAIAERHGLEKIKTIGDAYMVVGGVPTARPDHAEAVALMALEMAEVVSARRFGGDLSLAMRIGIHTGPVVAGVIGKKKFSYDLWGDTVNTASRMESHGEPGRVHVSDATAAKLRGGFAMTARGKIDVKGKGEMSTWFLEGRGG